MSKIFQVYEGHMFKHYPEYTSVADTEGKYAPDILFVEAPDYVFESWGYDETAQGDERFIKPIPPDGFLYDEETGTFYPVEYVDIYKRLRYEELTRRKIREQYAETDEFKIMREYLASPNDAEKQAQFSEYNAFVETCKAEARNEIYGDTSE